ncbi:unnamed protein product [Protopolystoma xenopodis]|uniref:CS domain-containing protein n=1 Tax=Protopolystoma xenopodis TaxID=117903 RepID=A0A448WNV6_9PLAT|nr:unnamed protein product [Protopolystoma xenopodis]
MRSKKLGFPPGVALQMVIKTMMKYQGIFEEYQRNRAQANLPPPPVAGKQAFLPECVKTGRDIAVVIDKQHVTVSAKIDGELKTILNKNLCWEIKRDESLWTLLSKESQERWWESAFPDEEKLDTRKMDCSRPMHELDAEAQAKIQQLMYDEWQKRQGLPTSGQQQVHHILEKAWDQEGSPFRGTPFDPTRWFNPFGDEH